MNLQNGYTKMYSDYNKAAEHEGAPLYATKAATQAVSAEDAMMISCRADNLQYINLLDGGYKYFYSDGENLFASVKNYKTDNDIKFVITDPSGKIVLGKADIEAPVAQPVVTPVAEPSVTPETVEINLAAAGANATIAVFAGSQALQTGVNTVPVNAEVTVSVTPEVGYEVTEQSISVNNSIINTNSFIATANTNLIITVLTAAATTEVSNPVV